jgi:tyrosyl-tRNA synthetase
MLPGLRTKANSHTDSKIDLLDPPDVVAKKIKKAEAAPSVTEGNGLLAFTEFVLLPASSLYGGGEFIVDRERDNLPPLVYKDVAKMHADYQNDIVCPGPV